MRIPRASTPRHEGVGGDGELAVEVMTDSGSCMWMGAWEGCLKACRARGGRFR